MIDWVFDAMYLYENILIHLILIGSLQARENNSNDDENFPSIEQAVATIDLVTFKISPTPETLRNPDMVQELLSSS